MLRWFFEKRDEDLWPLFDGLHIARAGDAYRAHFQRYPVVYVSFKATRADRFEVCRDGLRLMIRDLYHVRVALLERGMLDEWEKADFLAVLDGSASEAVYRRSLLCLTGILYRVHGERAVVLIDEYDAPIHAGWAHGYYHEVADFFRGFFEAARRTIHTFTRRPDGHPPGRQGEHLLRTEQPGRIYVARRGAWHLLWIHGGRGGRAVREGRRARTRDSVSGDRDATDAVDESPPG
jgi:Predicted AAA-ATPase